MSETPKPTSNANAFGGVTPIFRVESLQKSLDYYLDVLGFKIHFYYPGIMASVSRDRCEIFLVEGDQGHPGAWVWIGVGDVELIFDEYETKGANIRHPPTNYSWAREMQVEDPDGNVLRIGSDPRENEPLGEWLDMRGERWAPLTGGGWTKVNSE